jgi:hypothetical protein
MPLGMAFCFFVFMPLLFFFMPSVVTCASVFFFLSFFSFFFFFYSQLPLQYSNLRSLTLNIILNYCAPNSYKQQIKNI